MAKAVVLLSGGIDSATTLFMARAAGRACYALSFDYSQRHHAELRAAAEIARHAGVVEHKIITIDLSTIGGSAITDPSIAVPETPGTGIPVTYVPARNTVFLSLALAWAEVVKAQEIHIGVNAVDYSGYPDCRPAFIEAFETMARLATRAGVEGGELRVVAPLSNMTKAEIVSRGIELGLDYGQTVSCYQADEDGRACGRCDSCRIRRRGFVESGVEDPTQYQP